MESRIVKKLTNDLTDPASTWLDIRSPIEFHRSHLPGSVNIPLLNDQEREHVGLCYKERGQDSAIALGHQMVSGPVKAQRLNAWKAFFHQNPSAKLFCARGGLRSEIVQDWVRKEGVDCERIEGGYKRIRHTLLTTLPYNLEATELIVLTGYTGSGKTEYGPRIAADRNMKFLDLEKFANHRGSAFGAIGPQPSQATFENSISLFLIQSRTQKVLVEDESPKLGQLVLPDILREKMKSARRLFLAASLDDRTRQIVQDYVKTPLEKLPKEFVAERLKQSLQKIERQLGGLRTQECIELLSKAFSNSEDKHSEWVRYLLKNYYDPYYRKALLKSGDQPMEHIELQSLQR